MPSRDTRVVNFISSRQVCLRTTAYYEDDDDKCFDEQQTENGVEGEEEKYMDEGEVQSARSVYMRFFPHAMELILCL